MKGQTHDTEGRVAIVTGANRGIGFETCRLLARQGFRVVLASRDPGKGRAAAETLRREGLKVDPAELDVADAAGIKRFAAMVRKEYGRVDVLVNNAGIFLDREPEAGRKNGPLPAALEADPEVIRKSMETNVYGPFQLIQALVPLMRERNHGRIINVSSGMGQLTEMNDGYPGYRISKTALNAVTRIFSEELKSTDIQVNSICPGWVKTDMGGKEAPRTTEQGADTVVWLATQPPGGPTGKFFRDRKPLQW
jgi:NAD(P)-dependent dehydrogenase (short-subunit alcohol dehydrogenase family)